MRIYNLKYKEKKPCLVDLVSKHFPEHKEIKVRCIYSNRGNLKGLMIQPSGSKRVLAYMDLLSNVIYYLNRKKVVNKKGL